ncbi:MAG: hypothetical protein ACK5KO_04755 [Arachnia sp.]
MITHLLVAGVRGGVGTTTLTALIHALLTSQGVRVQVADHSEGILGSRLSDEPGPGAEEQPTWTHTLSNAIQTVRLLDAGRYRPTFDELVAAPSTGLILVGSGDTESIAALNQISEPLAAQDAARIGLCLVNVRRQRWPRAAPAHTDTGLPITRLPFETLLATWGPVSAAELAFVGRGTVAALNTLLARLLTRGAAQ